MNFRLGRFVYDILATAAVKPIKIGKLRLISFEQYRLLDAVTHQQRKHHTTRATTSNHTYTKI